MLVLAEKQQWEWEWLGEGDREQVTGDSNKVTVKR
jgi:hypothetical protein